MFELEKHIVTGTVTVTLVYLNMYPLGLEIGDTCLEGVYQGPMYCLFGVKK